MIRSDPMLRSYSTDVSADTNIVTTAETVVATLSGVSVARLGEIPRLHGVVSITLGTATTAVVLRVRRDSVTGTVVGEVQTDQIYSAAGSNETHEIVVSDIGVGELAGATYVLTVVQTAATGNGTATHASLEAQLGS
jgi:hypothetical protein